METGYFPLHVNGSMQGVSNVLATQDPLTVVEIVIITLCMEGEKLDNNIQSCDIKEKHVQVIVHIGYYK